jgi:hypothetical protein
VRGSMAGRSLRAVRSPEAPKITSTAAIGDPHRRSCGGSLPGIEEPGTDLTAPQIPGGRARDHAFPLGGNHHGRRAPLRPACHALCRTRSFHPISRGKRDTGPLGAGRPSAEPRSRVPSRASPRP